MTVTWYETLNYMLTTLEAEQRKWSKNQANIVAEQGCEVPWERARQMADKVRVEMRNVRFNLKMQEKEV